MFPLANSGTTIERLVWQPWEHTTPDNLTFVDTQKQGANLDEVTVEVGKAVLELSELTKHHIETGMSIG